MSFASAQIEHDRQYLVHALTINLSTDKSVLALSDPVIVKITTTNNSKDALDLPSGPASWSIRRADGKTVPDSPEGRKRNDARRTPQTVVVTQLLEPGASVTGEETISNLYQMNNAGVYLVTLELPVSDGRDTDFIKSNTLRITIR